MDTERLTELTKSVQEAQIHRLADDLLRVRLPLPFALNHVNCYLLQDGSGWALVDTGLNTSLARTAWRQVWDVLALAPTDITRIFVTHVHPDHLGLSGWLQSESGAPVVMSARTREACRHIWEQPAEAWRAETEAYLRQNGLDVALTDMVLENMAGLRARVRPLPQVIQVVEPGQEVEIGRRRFRLFAAEGHADDQILFYDVGERLLLVGDQVLMGITPNIGTWPTTPPNPLGRYLASLARLLELDVALALPGHRQPIRDFRGRVQELLAHHARRLDAMWHAVDERGSTTFEIAQRVFPFENYSIHEVRFAIAETLAHLEYLLEEGRVRREVGSDGAWRFYRVAARATKGL